MDDGSAASGLLILCRKMHWFTAEIDTVLTVYTEKRRHGLIPPFFSGKI